MNKLGFVGYGSMASMLLKGFILSEMIPASQLAVSSRSKNQNILQLEEQWPDVEIMARNEEVAQKCRTLLIGVKPYDVRDVLKEILPYVSEETHLISIAAGVTIESLEKMAPCQVTRVIPSLTSEVGTGVSLVCHSKKVPEVKARFIESLLETVSAVSVIKEENFEAASNLTSSAPGYIAAILDEWMKSALRHSDLSQEVVYQMVISTLLGTAKLFVEKEMDFSQTMQRVATKGGITEEGIQLLQKGLPLLFDEVFTKTLDKYETLKANVNGRIWG